MNLHLTLLIQVTSGWIKEFNVTVEEIIGKYLYRFGVEGLSFLFILFLLINVFILMEDNLNRTPNTETIKAKTDKFNSKFKNFCVFKKKIIKLATKITYLEMIYMKTSD